MAHEQSETVQGPDGRWYLVYGRGTAVPGRRIPGTPSWGTPEAGDPYASARSKSTPPDAEKPLNVQRAWERVAGDATVDARRPASLASWRPDEASAAALSRLMQGAVPVDAPPQPAPQQGGGLMDWLQGLQSFMAPAAAPQRQLEMERLPAPPMDMNAAMQGIPAGQSVPRGAVSPWADYGPTDKAVAALLSLIGLPLDMRLYGTPPGRR